MDGCGWMDGCVVVSLQCINHLVSRAEQDHWVHFAPREPAPHFLGARAVRLPFTPCVRECRVTLARRGNDQLFPLRLTGLVSTLLVAPARVGERVPEIDCVYTVHARVHICVWTHTLPACTLIPAYPSTAPTPKAIRDRRSIVTVYFLACLPCLR